MKHSRKKQVEFETVIRSLLNDQAPFPKAYYRSFSDMDPSDEGKLRSIWNKIDPNRKEILITELINMAEEDTEVLFDDVGRIAIHDSAGPVRAAGIRLLWECNDMKLVPQYISMLTQDPDTNVRAAAATALGLFVYLGELEEIDQNLNNKIINALLSVMKGQDQPSVKRRALEGLGFASNNEVSIHIQNAFNTGDKEWMASALFAMGRSADSTKWHDPVITMIDHPIIDVQFEAIQAAGMLELEDARQPLLDMLEFYDETDENVRMAIVTALSKIGGEDVEETLEALLEHVEDDEEIQVIEDALEYVSFFHNGVLPMGMFDFNEALDDIDFLNDSDDTDHEEEFEDDDNNEIDVSNN